MRSNRGVRATVLALIFLSGSVLPISIFLPPVVRAAEPSGDTIFYFKDALNYEESPTDSGDFFGFPSLSLTFPTKQNDSWYPPCFNLKSEEYMYWLTILLSSFALEGSDEFNLSELFDLFGNESLEGYRLDLLFPSPFGIVETYTYQGTDPIEINGNVKFDLYLSSHFGLQKRFADNIEIGLYSINYESLLPFPKIIKNSTFKIPQKGGITNQLFYIEDVHYTLKPGESILFSIEMVPNEEPRFPNLKNFIQQLRNNSRIQNFEENIITCIEKIKDIFNSWIDEYPKIKPGPIRNGIVNLVKKWRELQENISIALEEFNVSLSDLTGLLKGIPLFSSSFIYDSITHPSSVTVPAQISSEDIRIYYLYQNQAMNEEPPTGNDTKPVVLKTETVLTWVGPTLDQRNKILVVKNTTVDLYLNKFRFLDFLGKTTVTVQLLDGNIVIATSEKIIGKTSKQNAPHEFTFTGSDYEMAYGHSLSIGISINKNSILNSIRGTKLYYDSLRTPSFVRAQFTETKNIQIQDVTSTPANGLIIPGGQVQYTCNVTSKYDDTVDIKNVIIDQQGEWEVTMQPDSLTISAGSSAEIQVTLTSKDNTKAAYGNMIDLSLEASGRTGLARTSASAEVSEDAIIHTVQIVGYTQRKNVTKGSNATFYFVIENNNTGAVDDVDSYTIIVESEHEWNLLYTQHITNLLRGAKTESQQIQVTVHIPKDTTVISDTLMFTVTSDSDPNVAATVTFTVTVVGSGILEQIYDFFESLAKSLGLNEMFGSYGPIALVAILMVIVLFFLIILALVLTRKVIRVICTDRIKELENGDEAIFEVTLQNLSKTTSTYQIIFEQNPVVSKWQVSVDPQMVTLQGRQSTLVKVIVQASDAVEPTDWLELPIHVSRVGKKKSEKITVLVMPKEGKPLLQISDVFSWPRDFNPGEMVTTSFKVENKGSVSARNITVFLFINGKIKNRATATIPAGSIANIQIPWIAVKGKNSLLIRVKE